MLHFPNAKINLGLSITDKRPDGYHNIETVLYPLPMLKEALEVLPAPDDAHTHFRLSGKVVAGHPHQNLVWKAYQLICQHYPAQATNINIHLIKTIPMGAGLGGGSADGAFMLRLLNKFYKLDLPDQTLATLALQLGSDCPFFIYNTPQLAKGRGEILTPLPLHLSQYSIQVICPSIHLSTAQAFAALQPKPATFDLSKLPELPLPQWKNVVFNDFETTVFAAHPALAAIKQQLYTDGALYASLSGSGSALYGIFAEGQSSSLTTNEQHEVFYFE